MFVQFLRADVIPNIIHSITPNISKRGANISLRSVTHKGTPSSKICFLMIIAETVHTVAMINIILTFTLKVNQYANV